MFDKATEVCCATNTSKRVKDFELTFIYCAHKLIKMYELLKQNNNKYCSHKFVYLGNVYFPTHNNHKTDISFIVFRLTLTPVLIEFL